MEKPTTNRRLIDANALIKKFRADRDLFVSAWNSFKEMHPKDKARVDELDMCIAETINAPTVDAVSRGVHDQVRWERDVAIEQLESYGISLGEKADVVKVVRCKDCKNVQKDEMFGGYWCNGTIVKGDYFCASGERKDNERKSD